MKHTIYTAWAGCGDPYVKRWYIYLPLCLLGFSGNKSVRNRQLKCLSPKKEERGEK
jgi:hypothetical protein